MENIEGAANRGPSMAAMQKAAEHNSSFEEGMDNLHTQLLEKEREIRARTEELEQGRSHKGTLTDPDLIQLADTVEEATLVTLAKLEQEKRDVAEKIEGRKRSLQ